MLNFVPFTPNTVAPTPTLIGSFTPRYVPTRPSAQTPVTYANEKVFRFEDGDETIAVRVTEHYRNEFTAIDAENYDYDSPVGYGDTQLSAIADLFEKLPRAASCPTNSVSDFGRSAASTSSGVRCGVRIGLSVTQQPSAARREQDH